MPSSISSSRVLREFSLDCALTFFLSRNLAPILLVTQEDVQLPDAPPGSHCGSSSPTSDHEGASDAEEAGAENEMYVILSERRGRACRDVHADPADAAHPDVAEEDRTAHYAERTFTFQITTLIAPRSPSPDKATTPFIVYRDIPSPTGNSHPSFAFLWSSPARNTHLMILSCWMCADGIVGCVVVDVVIYL
ncbi:hypothetical protein C8R43DRAFT_1131850 [Mycena crocata]|nr:hypothetical protein C8R43DRAFT_1131850 [Mycena crocata]